MNGKNTHFNHWATIVTSSIEILQARRKVQELAQKLGFTHVDQVLLSSAVSESCRILLDHFFSFKIRIENKDGLYIKIHTFTNHEADITSTSSDSGNILSIINLELLNSKRFFDEVQSVRENGSGPFLILRKWNRDSSTTTDH